MEETQKKRSATEHAEEKVQELVAKRTTGRLLQEQLQEVVKKLEAEGVSQTEARLLIQKIYKRDRREHSAEFHKRVRAATKGTSHREVKLHDREGRRQRFEERMEKVQRQLEKDGLLEQQQRLAQIIHLNGPRKKTELH